MSTCPLCRTQLADDCCEAERNRRDNFRREQEDRKALFDNLGIECRSRPSEEFPGEWEWMPYMPSLVAFLAELPFATVA